MTPTAVNDRKRIRTSPPVEDEDSHHSDDDHFRQCSDEHLTRPGQAERKRELERNRRNLVNIRFVELGKELRLSAPRADSSGRLNDTPNPNTTSVPSKGKRIDKEAVLKEAANRIAVQRRDLEAASARMTSMSTEIDNLRAEKVELRSDKTYLRDELETVRKEVQRLREDNINLWQAFRKASTFKESFGADVAKIPAEFFLSGTNAAVRQRSPTLSVGNVVGQQGLSVPASQLLQSQSPLQMPQLNRNHQQGQSLTQRQQQSDALETSGIHSSSHQNYTSAPAGTTTGLQDSFLMCTGADEIGDLFTNYVPGLLQNIGSINNQNGNLTESFENNSTPRNFLAVPTMSSNDPIRTPILPARSNREEADICHSNQVSTKSESEDADPLSDVAYCV